MSGWIGMVLIGFSVPPADGPPPTAGNARGAESSNFTVHSSSSQHDARQAAALCEQWRSRLQRYWCGQASDQAWSPQCELVIHAGRPEYLAAVGAGGSTSYGSSLIDFGRDKRVSRRRIDVRGDGGLGLAALPHEMTHLVLADLLDGRQPPRWADEGMALLADTREKQLLHERDLAHGLASGRAFRLAELLAIETYPHASRVPAFYGQSVSLTAFLALRGNPARFVEFLRRNQEDGYDEALRQVYAINGVAELERLWRENRTASRSGFHGVRITLDEAILERAAGAE